MHRIFQNLSPPSPSRNYLNLGKTDDVKWKYFQITRNRSCPDPQNRENPVTYKLSYIREGRHIPIVYDFYVFLTLEISLLLQN